MSVRNHEDIHAREGVTANTSMSENATLSCHSQILLTVERRGATNSEIAGTLVKLCAEARADAPGFC